jgi:hypothetical protein
MTSFLQIFYVGGTNLFVSFIADALVCPHHVLADAIRANAAGEAALVDVLARRPVLGNLETHWTLAMIRPLEKRMMIKFGWLCICCFTINNTRQIRALVWRKNIFLYSLKIKRKYKFYVEHCFIIDPFF